MYVYYIYDIYYKNATHLHVFYIHIFAYLFYFCANGGQKHQTYLELES